MVTHKISLPNLTVPVAKFFKIEDERRFLEKTEMHSYRNGLNKKIVGHRTKVEDKFPSQKMNSARYPSPPTDVSDDRKNESEGV